VKSRCGRRQPFALDQRKRGARKERGELRRIGKEEESKSRLISSVL